MRYPIQDELESEEFGNPVKTFAANFPFKKARGATLYRRGNMYYLLKDGDVLSYGHVDDYDTIIRGKIPK